MHRILKYSDRSSVSLLMCVQPQCLQNSIQRCLIPPEDFSETLHAVLNVLTVDKMTHNSRGHFLKRAVDKTAAVHCDTLALLVCVWSGRLPHRDRRDRGPGGWQHADGDGRGKGQAERHHLLHRHQPAEGGPGEHGGHVPPQEWHE